MRSLRQNTPEPNIPPQIETALQQHLLWLQSGGRDGRRANFAGESLRGLTLTGCYLAEANLRGCDVSHADLSGANLQGADFSEANLAQTNLRGAQLDGAHLTHCRAGGAYLDEASLVGANLSAAQLADVSARGANFSGAKLRDVVLDGAQLTGAMLQQADLRYASARRVLFEQADLSGADGRDAVFDGARFTAAHLRETLLKNSSLEQVALSDTDFNAALDLPAAYQSQGFALEKAAIDKEMQVLAQKRAELEHLEKQSDRQRLDVAKQRKLLTALRALEEDTSASLFAHMHVMRRLAMFWFMAVALCLTLLAAQVVQLPEAMLKTPQALALGSVVLIALSAHFYSAMSAFAVAKQFAGYVRLRHDKIEQIEALEKPSDAQGKNADEGVTFL